MNLNCYTKYFDLGSVKTDRSEEHTRNTGFYLFDLLLKNDGHDEFVRIVSNLCGSTSLKLDLLEAPLLRSLDLVKRERRSKAFLNKLCGRLEHLCGDFEKKLNWYDRFARDRVLEAARKTVQSLAERARAM